MPQNKIFQSFFIENVHFDLSYSTPRELGKKLASIALTSCAIQKAKPTDLLFSAALPQTTPSLFLAEFETGLKSIAKKNHVSVTLTATSVSPAALVLHLTTLGSPLSIKGTKPKNGDVLVVAGHCGTAASGLSLLKAYGRGALEKEPEAVNAQLLPSPRVTEVLSIYRRARIGSIGALGNGLADAVQSFCKENRTGALIEEELIPTSQSSWRAASLLSTNNLRLWSLYGGEDYGFIFACPSSKIKLIQSLTPKLKLTIIGKTVSQRAGIHLIAQSGEKILFESRIWNDLVRRHRTSLTKVLSS